MEVVETSNIINLRKQSAINYIEMESENIQQETDSDLLNRKPRTLFHYYFFFH